MPMTTQCVRGTASIHTVIPAFFTGRMTMADFGFAVSHTDGDARRGRLTTAHGTVETPVFMPVGTAATVKGMTSGAVARTGAEIVLANTYHLMLRPGSERVGTWAVCTNLWTGQSQF